MKFFIAYRFTGEAPEILGEALRKVSDGNLDIVKIRSCLKYQH